MAIEVERELLDQQWEHIESREHDIVVSGSAGSGKSKFAIFKTIDYALQVKGSLSLVTRKYGPSLDLTCRDELLNELNDMHIAYHHDKQRNMVYLFNGSRIWFKSVDVLGKFRSTEFDYIWIEQAEELNYYDYMELMRRLRGDKGGKPENYLQCVLTATPEDETHWMYKIFYDVDAIYQPIHFDYKQNFYLPTDYIRELQRLKQIDPELYHKYALGLWGKISNVIYPNWKRCPVIPETDLVFAGADWGFNNPSAFILLGYDGNNIFIKDEVYKTQLTNTEFLNECIAKCKELNINPKDLDVWGDPSEPDRMLEFGQAGFNILPGIKEPLTRIDMVKRMPVWVSDRCVNTWKENKSYKWMTDKNGDILDRPVKFNDHAMDAIGYALVGVMDMLGRAVPTDPYLIVGGEPDYY